MSNSSDIAIHFATQGIERVLSDMKRLEDVTRSIAHKSAAVEKALALTTTGQQRAHAQQRIMQASSTANLLELAQRNGNKRLVNLLKGQLKEEQQLVGNALKALTDRRKGYAKQWEKDAVESAKSQAKAVEGALGSHASRKKKFQDDARKEASKSAADEAKAQAKAVDAALGHHAARRKKFKDEAEKHNAAVDQQQARLKREIKRTENSILKGEMGTGDGHSPWARRKALQSMLGSRDPAAIKAAIEKSRDDAEANAARGGGQVASKIHKEESDRVKGLNKDAEDGKKRHHDQLKKLDSELHSANKAFDKKETQRKNEAAREAKRANGERVREEKRVARESIRHRSARESYQRRQMENFGRFGAMAVGAALGTGIGAATWGVNTLLNAGGGFSVDQSVQERVQFERQAALVANKAPGGSRPTEQVMKNAAALSIKSGYDRATIVNAAGTFFDKAGPRNMKEFNEGFENVNFFTKLAKASGADLNDVANTAGLLKTQNPKLAPVDMERILLQAFDQGRRGAIDFPELATALPSITKTATNYAGSQSDNAIQLLGAAQVLRGNGSVAEASTALSNISQDMLSHKSEVKAFLGKDVFDKDGRLQSGGVSEMIAKLFEVSGGDQEKIMKMDSGKGVIGRRAIRAFQGRTADEFLAAKNEYKDTHKGEKDLEKNANKAGANRVRELFKEAVGKPYSKDDLEADFANVMSTSAERFEAATRNLKEQVGDKLVPAMLKLVPALEAMIPKLAQLIDLLATLLNLDGPNVKPVAKAPEIKDEGDLTSAKAQLVEMTTNPVAAPDKTNDTKASVFAATVDALGNEAYRMALGPVLGPVLAMTTGASATDLRNAHVKERDDSYKENVENREKSIQAFTKAIEEATARLRGSTAPGAGGVSVNNLPNVANPNHAGRGGLGGLPLRSPNH